jgi:hypothetical protein
MPAFHLPHAERELEKTYLENGPHATPFSSCVASTLSAWGLFENEQDASEPLARVSEFEGLLR